MVDNLQLSGGHSIAVVSARESSAEMQNVAVFLSYASLDNAVPEDKPSAVGFVSCLQRNLLFELETELGRQGVLLWRDRSAIEPGDRWSEKIIEALREARILLVVLSRTYVKREWCSRELETFAGKLESSLDAEHVGLILRVDKQKLQDSEIPEVLRPIQAVRFFDHDQLNDEDRPFFWRGRVQDERFFEAVRDLAMAIDRAIARPSSRHALCELNESAQAQVIEAPSNGRTIFVAKVAQELRDAYRSVVTELKSRGYRIVPHESDDLPDEIVDAERVIADVLTEAELAVHLVGRRPGSTPHGSERGIVPLQLALSGVHALQKNISRIIWAPRLLDTYKERGETGDLGFTTDERDPLERVAAMDAALLPGDQVDGRPFAGFREFLVRELVDCL